VQEREAHPLYTVREAQASLRRLRPVDYGQSVEPGTGLRCKFRDAGHILGSAIIELWWTSAGATRKLVFSGDIGEAGRPIVNDPTLIEEADTLLVESTYGNRRHKSFADTEEELAGIVNAMVESGRGNIIIPAFAIGRTQELLHILGELVRRGAIRSPLSVYVDSPLATRATEATLRHQSIVDRETRELIAWGRANPRAGLVIRFTESLEESKRLNHVRHGALIISASGMCDAGRIKYHLLHNLPNADSVIVFTGFQAAGTLGRRLVDGARSVRIFGEEVPVRARIATLGGLSAHADQAGLMKWLRGFKRAPSRTYVVHGEAATAAAFADRVRTELGWQVAVPGPRETAEV
jgi:metallo-beta-lactamase family protein